MKRLLACVVVAVVAGSAFAAAPVIVSLDPPKAVAGTLTSLVVTITGANFVNGVSARVDGAPRITTFVSPTQVQLNLVNADLDSVQTLSITVASTTQTSNAVAFDVITNAPRITSIDPSQVISGTGQFTLRVIGTAFATTAKVRVNGSPRDTTYIDTQTLEGTILANDIASPVNLNITVINPSNKISNLVTLQAARESAVPVLTLLSPDRVTAGGNDFTLTLVGRNFDSRAVVKLDGVNANTTTFVNNEKLTAKVIKSTIATAKTIQVTVVNPNAPASSALPLKVVSEKLPVLDSITPVSIRAGSGPTQLQANGSAFINGSIIRVDGVQQTTTFVSANRLTATLTSSQLSIAKDLKITVFTAGTDGGESQPKTLTIIPADAPVINAISPTTINAGSATRTIIVIGGTYADGDTVLVNGVARDTDFSTSTQLIATLDASDVANAGTLQIQVKKKLGGSTSAPFELRVVNAAAPVIESLSPTSGTAGSDPFVLSINGRNFASIAVVTFDGETHASTFVSPNRIDVSVLPADTQVPRNIEIRVTNPDGTASDPFTFPVVVITPQITALDPTTVAAGDPGFTLTVAGSDFGSSAKIAFDGLQRTSTFNTSTGRISTTVFTSDLSQPRTIDVTVVDRGFPSNALPLTVLRPLITALDPPFAFAGSSNVAVVVSGTSFLPTSRVEFKGIERTTNFVSANQLTAILPAESLFELGSFSINVRNSAEALSLPFPFTVVSPGLPVISALSPSAALAGSFPLEVHILGANFLADAVARVNGSPHITSFISSGELVIQLTLAELAIPGALQITVLTSGNTSAPANFLVTSGPPPPRRRAAGH
ncbi:MAG TPA: IPT/TIG domain-containing protein [Thermoanaerobaculia bacterium]|nr:IPT/TIG domain-containing protein [Thermoanaerobaculia bacterium]